MSGDMDFVSQLMEITGLDKTTAENVLRINNNNLEQAINYHLENNHDYSNTSEDDNSCSNSNSNKRKIAATSSTGGSQHQNNFNYSGNNSAYLSSTTSTAANNETDNIRAPIPSRREQLLLPEEDNFRFRKRRTPAFTICPLRNFAREAEIQEQQLAATGNFISSHIGNDYTSSSAFGPVSINRYSDHYSSTSKRSRLEDLFRPPTDLLFWGTFQAARDYATSMNRWLIVNLQDNSEFKSQILNRDIWPDPDLKELILKYFIFWQVSVDNPEGLRFKIFYHVNTMPYVCIIDPRTGEDKFTCDVVTPQTFRVDLNEFLVQNSFTLESKKNLPSSSTTSLNNLQKSETVTNLNQLKTSELSEDDQLELAIKNSLKETQSKSLTSIEAITTTLNNDNENSLDATAYDDSTTQSENDITEILDSDNPESPPEENYKQFLGNKNDPITKIQLRLPAGERDQLEWPSSTKLRAVKLYVQLKYPDITKDPYKIILSFPRQNILELDDGLTLQKANLHPSVILHLHPDD